MLYHLHTSQDLGEISNNKYWMLLLYYLNIAANNELEMKIFRKYTEKLNAVFLETEKDWKETAPW